MQNIKQRIAVVREQINEAAVKTGRSIDDICLVGVTKTVDIDSMNEAVLNGIQHIGENRVQEILQKYDHIPANVSWHLIGQLQTNKVKYIIDKVELIQSLDRLGLAEEIQKRSEKLEKITNVLIQVNIGKEDTKSGVYEENLLQFVQQIAEFPNIHIKGLMAIAPFTEDLESLRPYFRSMKRWFEDIKGKKFEGVDMQYLSMGMSNDFTIAIEEGSNMVRIGSAIFGRRTFHKNTDNSNRNR